MSIPDNRKWMYNRLTRDRALEHEFLMGVSQFIRHASELPSYKANGDKMKCPCSKCKCGPWKSADEVSNHLINKGFMEDYYVWSWHGEFDQSSRQGIPFCGSSSRTNRGPNDFRHFEDMVYDAAGPDFVAHAMEQEGDYGQEEDVEEDPNPETQSFYEMLADSREPLWEGCETYSKLSATSYALKLKSDYNMPEACFNKMVKFMRDVLPVGNHMPTSLYAAKKIVEQLGLGCERIDCCRDGCMLYYKEDEGLDKCKFCQKDRYKEKTRTPYKEMFYFPLASRLKRLFSSEATAEAMRWHHDVERDREFLCHPSDGKAWQHFNEVHPRFAADPRNVRLGLCADGFNPFGKSGKVYSSWPIVLTPYNLPPGMCMKREFMFLTLLIPGPKDPRAKIDVYMRPLIDELKMLWDVGVNTYDISTKTNFDLKAALMWTVNDFPAYGMLSGWSTAGRLSCPICMEHSKAFSLKYSRKISHFDCHRRYLPKHHHFRTNVNQFKKNVVEKDKAPPLLTSEQVWRRVRVLPTIQDPRWKKKLPRHGVDHNWTRQCILWELPYWKTHLLRHNIDVMHTERNVFMNILNTVMDIKGKTKDTAKGRLDIEMICDRPKLQLVGNNRGKEKVKPKAAYVLNKEQRLALCKWVANLKLPDRYVSNLGRCVDLTVGSLQGLKSHDCHVFMQRLLPIAFDALPKPIWEAFTELSQFFKELTSTSLQVKKLKKMQKDIAIILCKLESFLPPSFFDSMEHLIIHLPHEAIVGGPAQYRWMYCFERFVYTYTLVYIPLCY